MNESVEQVAEPVNPQLIKKELREEFLIGPTNKGSNLIYSITAHNCPNVMNEIGRLREMAFRAAGGGTGKRMDIDHLDRSDPGYHQLIVYQPDDEVIIGGYRYIDCSNLCQTDRPGQLMSTSHYFELSEVFVKEYLPFTIELGRSWVRPDYQTLIDPRKGLFALANLWDGLGVLIARNPHVKYFFGKVTMYPDFNREARNLLLSFMKYFFEDVDNLVVPKEPLVFEYKKAEIEKHFVGLKRKQAISALRKMLKSYGESIPPLINLYMGLSPTMRVFGTSINRDFGDVEETGILVTIGDIDSDRRERHIP
jgi:hypothetical protein